MAQGERRPIRYEFQVTTTARVNVTAMDGRQAREVVEQALDGPAARLTSGSGAGLELLDVRVAGPVTLTAMDGIDPVATLEAALRRYDASGGER